MSSLKKRAIERRANITINKTTLHSKEYNSFHVNLDDKSAWELLAKLSKEAWIEKTGQIPNNFVDKTVVKFIRN